MEKRLTIEGMSCGHCTARVEKALNKIDGVIAHVDLQGADVSMNMSISDEELIQKVTEAGYKVTGIQG